MNIEISFYGDEDGYINMECPFCESEFKVLIDDLQNDDIETDVLFCPYCGLKDERDHFYTKDQVDVIQAHMNNLAIDMLNKTFGDVSKRLNRKNSILRMTHKPIKNVNVQEYKEICGSEVIKKCGECGFEYKVLNHMGETVTYCVSCGGINHE